MDVKLVHNDYRVTINTLGAELISYQDADGIELIWSDPSEKYKLHSPVLFPAIGNVKNGKTIIRGKEVSMPKDGFAKDMEFAITEQTGDHACFLLTDVPDTHEIYPFAFALSMTYQLFGSRLVITYTVTNRDTEDMPYHIGVQPSFHLPFLDEPSTTMRDYEIAFDKTEEMMAAIYDVTSMNFSPRRNKLYSKRNHGFRLKSALFNEDVIYFPNLKSKKVTLRSLISDREITVSYPDFQGISFWTPFGGTTPFLSIAPWNGSAIYDDETNDFATRRRMELLSPGESRSYRMEIMVG